MAKENLTERIGFRLRGEEFKQVVRLATGKDVSPDDWCREAVREKLAAIRAEASRVPASSMAPVSADRAGSQAQGSNPMTPGEVVLFLELTRLRWLFQEFVSCLGRDALTPEACRLLHDQANKPDGPVTELAKKWMRIYRVRESRPTN
jgi:hypothetical protein